MKVFIGGACEPKNIFTLVDPTTFSEAEFEKHVITALNCICRDYYCIPFRGAFQLDGRVNEADLALVHTSLSHWFVLEVELVSHSLRNHVLPQVRCFRYGTPLGSCAEYLSHYLPGLDLMQAESLVQFVPRGVAVVANRSESEWEAVLGAVDTQFVSLSVFACGDGGVGHEMDGTLHVTQESLGIFTYSALDRSFRMPRSFALPEGVVQIQDPNGVMGLWIVRKAADVLWVTKDSGDPGIPHNAMLQLTRTHTGSLTLRRL